LLRQKRPMAKNPWGGKRSSKKTRLKNKRTYGGARGGTVRWRLSPKFKRPKLGWRILVKKKQKDEGKRKKERLSPVYEEGPTYLPPPKKKSPWWGGKRGSQKTRKKKGKQGSGTEMP